MKSLLDNKTVKETIRIIGAGKDTASRLADERNKQEVFKNCLRLTKCISEMSKYKIMCK